MPWVLHLAQNPSVQGNGIMSLGPEKKGTEQPGLHIMCGSEFLDCTYKGKEIQKTSAEDAHGYETKEKWANLALRGGCPSPTIGNGDAPGGPAR
jgi:hypothetical protein